jgi:hypothetical protein
MRQFSGSGFRIWNLSREAKVIYTGFGLFALLAFFFSGLLYDDLVGAPHSIAGYYAGVEGGRTRAITSHKGTSIEMPIDHGGPVLELPPESEMPSPAAVAVPYRKLLEVTHFHLFTVPVFLLIITHLFMLTELTGSTKLGWIVAAYLATLFHMGAPWLIRYGGARFAPLYAISGVALALTFTVLTVYPMVVMWRRRSFPVPAP